MSKSFLFANYSINDYLLSEQLPWDIEEIEVLDYLENFVIENLSVWTSISLND